MNHQAEWDKTNRDIEWLKQQFCNLHQVSTKDWSEEQHSRAREYRSCCVSTGEYRYWILSLARAQGIKLL
jgi:hypothetical protein